VRKLAKGRVIVDTERCKSCGLCVSVCPRKVLSLDESYINTKGVHPAYMLNAEDCIGCGSCGIICPDVAITVQREI